MFAVTVFPGLPDVEKCLAKRKYSVEGKRGVMVLVCSPVDDTVIVPEYAASSPDIRALREGATLVVET